MKQQNKTIRAAKPTRAQKKIIQAAGLVWENWLVKEEDNLTLTLINKQSHRIRVLIK